MSGNVIYGIDLNPAFKPRAIIQSRSPFPSFSTFAGPPFSSRSSSSSVSASRSAVYYPSRARSILNIYLGTYPSYSRGTRSRIIYTRIANPVDSLRPRIHCPLRLRTDFFTGLSSRSGLISRPPRFPSRRISNADARRNDRYPKVLAPAPRGQGQI